MLLGFLQILQIFHDLLEVVLRVLVLHVGEPAAASGDDDGEDEQQVLHVVVAHCSGDGGDDGRDGDGR